MGKRVEVCCRHIDFIAERDFVDLLQHLGNVAAKLGELDAADVRYQTC